MVEKAATEAKAAAKLAEIKSQMGILSDAPPADGVVEDPSVSEDGEPPADNGPDDSQEDA